MTIVYPISLPSVPWPSKSQITSQNAVAVTESPFTFEEQVFQHPGARWKIALTFPSMKRSVAEGFVAAMTSLNGRVGTFLYGDMDATAPQGVATGTPLVNGANQTGNTLNTDGWSHNVGGILKAGDMFDIGSGSLRRMHKVLQTANSDSLGQSALTIWPPLRYSPADNTPINLVRTMTQFRLDADFMWSADEVSTYGVSFTASEAL